MPIPLALLSMRGARWGARCSLIALCGCEALWGSLGRDNPDNCVHAPGGCGPDEVCDPVGQVCVSGVEIRDSHVGGWNSLINKQQLYAENLAIAEGKHRAIERVEARMSTAEQFPATGAE